MVHTYICDDKFLIFDIRIPSAGFFNKDDIPDFLVRYNYGTGFPVYFYSNVSLFLLVTCMQFYYIQMIPL